MLDSIYHDIKIILKYFWRENVRVLTLGQIKKYVLFRLHPEKKLG